MELPNKLIAIKNKDKKFHEQWSERRNPLNFPHPFRGVMMGPPNVGKSTCCKNLLLRAKPEFEEVFIIHCDPDYTQEYEDVGGKLIGSIPSPEQWDGQVKTLVILDDLEYKGMSKDERRALDRLFGYVSTHKNISVLLCAQDAFNIPPIVRRCSNLFVFWKNNDHDSMSNIARKSGISSYEFKQLFNEFIKEPRDSLWIDMTCGSPYPLRKNGFTIIKKL